jgi:hypothetical protein
VIFVATIKGMKKIFFSPLSFVEVFGSGIQDQGTEIWDSRWVKNQDPGSRI